MKYAIKCIALSLILTGQSCTSVKPHEKIFITDPEMQMNKDASGGFRDYVSTIREGGTQAGSTKANGGCGCN